MVLNSVNTYSVCGSKETRKWRCAVIENDFPESDRFHNFSTVLGSDQFVPLALQMNSKSIQLNKLGVNIENVNEVDTFRSTILDTNLIIGQCCFKFFNSDPILLNESITTPTFMMGGSEDSDFNITKKGAEMFNQKLIISSSSCPRFSYSDWTRLTENYSPAMKTLHTTGVAAFFTSRFDGAFYRMFGLSTNLCNRIPEFERNVAFSIMSSTSFPDSIKSDQKLISIIEYTNISGIDWEYDQNSKSGGSESHWMILYKLWSDLLNVNSNPELMDELTEIILLELENIGSEGANEYDGYTASCMLYHSAHKPYPTHAEHYHALLDLYQNNKVKEEWVQGLYNILYYGNLNIIHDTGLDPFVDDSIAIKIIYSSLLVLESL
jgi:hypothetical protein